MFQPIATILLTDVCGGGLTLTDRTMPSNDWSKSWDSLMPRNQSEKNLNPLIDPSMTRQPSNGSMDPGMLRDGIGSMPDFGDA